MTPSAIDLERPPEGPAATQELRRALLAHYDRCRRDLPWRGETDPYRVLVSEFMLQQTRVETVSRYYGRWLERFPDLCALADADEGAVLKAWEGLGYYRRARSLHRAAQIARERPEGSLPTSYEELKELPGVGAYTAGAVASIAFGERVPAPDGNVRRVLARLFDEPEARPAWLRDTSARLVDPERPGDWNQALMDLGATVCVPASPRCGECPVARWCAARAAGSQAERPARRARSEVRRARFALAALRDGDRVLLRRRPPEGLLGGMWAFPEREIVEDDEVEGAVLALARDLTAPPLGNPERLAAYDHRFTHLLATYEPCVLPVRGTGIAGDDLAWITPGEPIRLAVPVAQRRLLEELARLRAGVSAAGTESPRPTKRAASREGGAPRRP